MSRTGGVAVIIGAGQIGLAIARRTCAGRRILVADLSLEHAERAAQSLADVGFDAQAVVADVADRLSVAHLAERAASLGAVEILVHSAGISPSMADPATILRVDLYGTALVLEKFGEVMAPRGAGVVISSQSGHRLPALPPEQDAALALSPTEDLLGLTMLAGDAVADSLHAYQLAKRGNALRVAAQAVAWGKRGARINSISPGIVMTPLARHELAGPRGETYQRMLELSPAGRAGTPDEVATLAALLLGEDGAWITGSDFLIDGGATAAWKFGALRPA